MPIKTPTHVYRNRHGTFYFRYVLPLALRPPGGPRELRLSLGTEERRKAIALAHHLLTFLPQLRHDVAGMAKNEEEDEAKPSPDYQKGVLRGRIALLKAEAREREETYQWERIAAQRAHERAARELRAVALTEGELRGRKEAEAALAFPWPPKRTPYFSELLEEYLAHLAARPMRGARARPRDKTHEAYRKDIGAFIDVVGDLRIGEIDRRRAREYFETSCRLPANITRRKQFAGKGIAAIIAMCPEPQSEANVSKKMERTSAMFKWALEERRRWGIDSNPFAGYGQANSETSKRRPFTDAELQQLLSHPDFGRRRFVNSYAYWLIPLALYTGARLGELAQLDLKDFVEVEGIACIDINDIDAKEIGAKKQIKNRNARRLVPIHSDLIDLGILRYVETLRKKREIHLFPELSRTRRDGPAQAASNWFQRFRAAVGLTTKQETVFHSFRNYFITALLNGGAAPYAVAPIVGHEGATITENVYWGKRDAKVRKKVIDVFKLPEDLKLMMPKVEDVLFEKRKARKHGI